MTNKSICLSPSTIAMFLDCPRCFWLQINEGKKRPAGIFPSLPNGMDKILKEHFDLHRESGKVPQELDGKFDVRLFDDKDKLKVWRSRKGLKYTDESTGAELKGILDDLLVAKNGEYVVLDFKTRGFPLKEDTHEHYQHQMDIYAFLLEKNGMKPADYAILLFYHPLKVGENHNILFHPEPVKIKVSLQHAEKIFLDAVKCLQGKEPERNDHCEWCKW